jgi:hypothetical protein
MKSSAFTGIHAALLLALVLTPLSAEAQEAKRGSDNIEVLAHIPLGEPLTVADIDLEQELSRPYAYVSRMFETGFDIVDLSDPSRAKIIYEWRIENSELHRGTGAMDPKTFKLAGRYYLVQSTQFMPGGPDADVGAIVFDVTGLPDISKVEEVGRIREPEHLMGFHNIFIYKHSDSRVLLMTTTQGPYANVYDMGMFLENPQGDARVARVGIPSGAVEGGVADGLVGYHDLYAAYHPETGTDRFYGGGAGGYYVYDISNLEDMKILASVTGVPGVRWGHTFTPTPDGRYAVGETEYQYAPLRIFDLQPALEGTVPTIRLPIGAWTANWENLAHNHEMRWPYVFVSGYEDGLQIFNMEDPTKPITVGYFDTYQGPHKVGMCGDRVCNGAFGVDVRNADGLIVVSDMTTGFWTFRMEGFDGWNGEDWGMPDISSAQDWDNGPRATGTR